MTQDIEGRGNEVAARLATALGFGLVSLDRIEQRIAERMWISQGTVHRLLEGRASLVERWMVRPHRLARHMAEQIVELTPRGNAVVHTRAETALWCLLPRVICVHVYASPQPRQLVPFDRSGAVAARLWSRPPAANTIRRLCAGGQEGLEHYDLVFNAEHLSVDECARHVRRLAQRLQSQTSAASLPSWSTMHFSLGSWSIWDATTEHTTPAEERALEAEVAGDTIRLPAGVSNEEAIACIEQHLRGKKDCAVVTARRYLPLINQAAL
jgi:hypothetical protein